MVKKSSKPLFAEIESLQICRRTYLEMPIRAISFGLGLSIYHTRKLFRKAGISCPQQLAVSLPRRFLSELPCLSEQLPFEFRRRIRLYWHTVKNENSLPFEKEEMVRRFLYRYFSFVPMIVIGETFDIPRLYLDEISSQEGIKLSRSSSRSIWVNFASSGKCPNVIGLSLVQRSNFWNSWRARKAKWDHLQKTRQSSKKTYESYLEKLRFVRGNDFDGSKMFPCSGGCKESWPRSNVFFPKSLRSEDGLAAKCKCCSFAVSTDATRQKRKRTEKGRVILGVREKERIVALYRAYGLLIPVQLWSSFLHLNNSVLERLRLEAKVKISSQLKIEIPWRWYFMQEMPDLPLLSQIEVETLFEETQNFRKKIDKEFERDSLFEVEQSRLSIQRVEEARSQNRVSETMKCRNCNNSYFISEEFFKMRKGKCENYCKVCVNFENKQQRFRRNKMKYGSSREI